MAKKSAKSKGYRKTTGKKPYLTKRDVIMLCALVAVIVVGAILLFSYDDGALKMKDGVLTETSENWLIVNGSAKGRRYYKLGEAGEIEGYARETTPGMADANINAIKYVAEDESAAVKSIALSTVPAKVERAAEYYRSLLKAAEPTEIQTADASGTTCLWFSYKNAWHADEAEAADEAADAEEAAPNRFEQALHAYIAAPHDCAIGLSVAAEVASESDYLSDEQLLEAAAKAIGAISVEAK